MSSPYGPSGGNDPQQQWGQQPYGGGYPGTPSGGFPAQNPYGQPQQPGQQQPGQPGQQQPYPGYDPNQQQQQQNPYAQPGQQQPYGQPDPYGQQTQQYGVPGQYGQPGQPGQYGQPPQQKKSSAMIWVVAAVVVLIVGAILFTGFVSPAFLKKKIFDNTAVQNGIVKILKDEYKISDVGSATCSGENEVKPNTSFNCKVQVGGKDKTVKITVKTEDGEYEVGQPTG